MLNGGFGMHGGQFIPGTLMNAVTELETAYEYYKNNPQFMAELRYLLEEYTGRPSRLYYAEKTTANLGGVKIYLKREDLSHTGSHKINNALGQVLLTEKMRKTCVIAKTGAGQHGVTTATAAAPLGPEREVPMGEEDTDRQALNVYCMELLGMEVYPVTSSTMTLKDAVNKTLGEWINRVTGTHYVIGPIMGPHPFPMTVRDFQSVTGREVKEQLKKREGELPHTVVVCVGEGSSAMEASYKFTQDESIKSMGYEAINLGMDNERNAATTANGRLGIFHGMKPYFYQDEYDQITSAYSISTGLDYPGIDPEHAQFYDGKRAEYVSVADGEAVGSFEHPSRVEDVIPAVESAHIVVYARRVTGTIDKDQIITINFSGRGDEGVAAIARYRGVELYEQDTGSI